MLLRIKCPQFNYGDIIGKNKLLSWNRLPKRKQTSYVYIIKEMLGIAEIKKMFNNEDKIRYEDTNVLFSQTIKMKAFPKKNNVESS